MKREENVHKAVCKYLSLQYPDVVFISDPSGIRLTIGQAKTLKCLRSDDKIPDLFIAAANKDHHGLFLEIKTDTLDAFKKDGGVRECEHIQEQYKTLKKLRAEGYAAEFGCGFDECRRIIDKYMS